MVIIFNTFNVVCYYTGEKGNIYIVDIYKYEKDQEVSIFDVVEELGKMKDIEKLCLEKLK